MWITEERLRRLPRTDLDFIIETVVTRRRDYDNIREIIQDKPDFIDVMLDDEKLFRRVVADEEILLKISPYLLFTILLRRAHRDLQKSSYTMEYVGRDQKVPVFDAKEVAEFLNDKDVRDYLAEMLSTFTKTESTTIYFRSGRTTYKRTYSDMSINDMTELAGMVKEEFRFPFYKRIGDVCLFMTGIFPEHVVSEGGELRGERSWMSIGVRAQRGIEEYETKGREFYRQASYEEAARAAGLDRVLAAIADNFTLARKPLNLISERYIPARRLQWFGPGVKIEG